MAERIVAVGLLTARDLEMLGGGFRRMFPVDDGHEFDALLLAIDRAVASKGGETMEAVPNAPGRAA